jgi:hypothetical protein
VVLTRPRIPPAYQPLSTEELFVEVRRVYGIAKPCKPMSVELDCIEDCCIIAVQYHAASGYHITIPSFSARLPLVLNE